MEIRKYSPDDESGWVRCRVLSFLNTAYFDNVLREKEKYLNPAIELVAIEDGIVVGLIDVEYETEERTVCSRGTGLGGMIWHIAVHPDYQRKGIGSQLLLQAVAAAKEIGLNRFEAWTRDDQWVRNWYVHSGFKQVDSYLHVYIEDKELEGALKSEMPKLKPIQSFAHYVGEDREKVMTKFKRVHECVCYEKQWKN